MFILIDTGLPIKKGEAGKILYPKEFGRKPVDFRYHSKSIVQIARDFVDIFEVVAYQNRGMTKNPRIFKTFDVDNHVPYQIEFNPQVNSGERTFGVNVCYSHIKDFDRYLPLYGRSLYMFDDTMDLPIPYYFYAKYPLRLVSMDYMGSYEDLVGTFSAPSLNEFNLPKFRYSEIFDLMFPEGVELEAYVSNQLSYYPRKILSERIEKDLNRCCPFYSKSIVNKIRVIEEDYVKTMGIPGLDSSSHEPSK